jgi:hypothetical protein
MLSILPAPYCSSLELAIAQQQGRNTSDNVERNAVLLEKAGYMSVPQKDASQEKNIQDRNTPHGETIEHTEAQRCKIVGETTRDAFERLLDVELLFVEFQQV